MNEPRKRVLEIVKLLQKRSYCIQELSEIFEVDKRTIQRDMAIIKEVLHPISTLKGCYTLKEPKFDIDNVEFINFFKIISLIEQNHISIKNKDFDNLFKKYKNKTKQIYYFFENPLEELKTNKKLIKDIKFAIYFNRYCDLVYHEKEERILKDIKPYKIIYAKNNWYLAAMTKNYKFNNGFKRFRINFIKDIKIHAKTFQIDIQIEEFIKNMHSLFEDYQKPKYEVILEANQNIKRYFKVKKYLPSQKILSETPNSLTLSYKINQDMEIIPLIKTWLPDLKVISPKRLDKTIRDIIKKY